MAKTIDFNIYNTINLQGGYGVISEYLHEIVIIILYISQYCANKLSNIKKSFKQNG